jgi:hypothetical protein
VSQEEKPIRIESDPLSAAGLWGGGLWENAYVSCAPAAVLRGSCGIGPRQLAVLTLKLVYKCPLAQKSTLEIY